MDETLWWLISIIGPALLLIVLIWLVLKRRSNRTTQELTEGTDNGTERATDRLYDEEERRRRAGTDDAEA